MILRAQSALSELYFNSTANGSSMIQWREERVIFSNLPVSLLSFASLVAKILLEETIPIKSI